MKSRWSDNEARGLEGLSILVHTSRLIGMDPGLVLWGGGNSSLKINGLDHTGRPIRVLWMKGSGSDMRTITPGQFTPLRLDDLLPLMKREAMTDDEMVAYQSKSVLEPGAPKPSIETLLHAFLPTTHIYHTHADAICALTDTPNGDEIIEELYGANVALIPYLRPGFLLSKKTGEAYAKNPGLRAIILDKHGLITWGASAKEAYLETIRMITLAERYIARRRRPRARPAGPAVSKRARRAIAAAVAPALRGGIGSGKRMVLFYDDDPAVLQFVNRPKAKALSQIGPFTPDHLMHTKPWPLFLETKGSGRPDPETIAATLPISLAQYRERYVRYFERHKTPGVTMLDPNPRVILIPGVGMFTTGKDRRASRIARDIYRHTLGVIQDSAAISSYVSLSPRELCDFEYWPMENFKLTLLPPEKEMSRRVALVTGAAGGIGKALAERLAVEGAMVVLTDIDLEKTRTVAEAINQKAGEANATAVKMDVTSESSVQKAFESAVLAYGGLDIIVSNAGIAKSSPVDRLSLSDWDRSMAVNATGHFLVCREALRIFKEQGLGGNIVVVATKNVLAPGKDFGAYSASKAAQAQLSRILAIEGAEDRIRVNMVNPDGVFQESGLWSKEIREERAKAHGIPIEQLEDFYARRNLLKTKIYPGDVAEAVLYFASDRSSKTTGAILPVDGGVREAFPR
ncbi:MAG TPA: bifunctional rhamnulose-1-phosphate aldolase/short-chain dehydrogenase [Nitrospiria bacterium]|jgi:rhamnulose-1-phosphate aldolase/alcohol dehydrogenase|nr:bifunctional rhamnulose-1-phosphate aldolase/short-chain dehydrogenase [Nitrospiria bacterium]